ncbi:hypothetical protein [Methanopyrus sp. KOL6]|uniref:hypothetical protein n=1 Tax=Methanopyrus sp. KOL6 TaxID=1937004 RepID=UPI000B4B971D|nr:hypothetical protein [Methanopyrus sp. KOL6]
MVHRDVYLAFMVGLQEALFETHGKMALALNRIAGLRMLELLEKDGLLEVSGENKNSLSEDIEEALRHADDAEVRVEGSEDELEVVIELCPFEKVRRELLDRDKMPVVCPYVTTILELAEMTFGAKYRLVEMNVDEDLCAFTLKRV